MALTDLMIRKLTPKKRRYEVSDGKGLGIRVMPSGAKSWIFRYLFDGLSRRMTLGKYPGISLANARQKHGEAMQLVQRGVDPGAKLQGEKARRKAAPTVKDLLDEFWEKELSEKKTGNEQWRLVQKDVLPKWGKRKVADITRRDAVILLDKVRERAPVGANRLQSVLVRMFYFAAERGIIEHSPLMGMKRKKEAPRKRVLTDEELKKFWKSLDTENKEVDIYVLVKLALKMILLTGQRGGEVVGTTWDEIDFDSNFWNIPKERMKNGDAQRVPLCPMAIEVLKQAQVYSGDSEYVFRSSHVGEGTPPKVKPLTRQALTRAVARHWSEMKISEAFTPHDLRRTLRTRLEELGIKDIIAERVLGHKLQGLLAVYNQYPYDTEKRQALWQWENMLREIIGAKGQVASNVLQFAR
jgi:integrase